MRSGSLLLVSSVLALVATACPAPQCRDDDNCPSNLPFCVEGVCAASEGEGDVVAEGEGDVVGEGEGDVDVGYVAEDVSVVGGFAFSAAVRDFAVADDGRFVIDAQPQLGTVDGTGAPLTVAECPSAGQTCPFVYGADADGGVRWSLLFRNAEGSASFYEMAVADDVVWVAGISGATAVRDDGVATDVADEFIAAFDLEDGALRFTRATPVGASNSGSVVIGGLPGGSLAYLESTDVFGETDVVVIDRDGVEQRRQHVNAQPSQLQGSGDGLVVVTGFSGNLEFDGVRQLQVAAGDAAGVLVLDDDGAVTFAWSPTPADDLGDAPRDQLVSFTRGRNGANLAVLNNDDDLVLVAVDDSGVEHARHGVLAGFDYEAIARDDGFLVVTYAGPFAEGASIPFGNGLSFVSGGGDADVLVANVDDVGNVAGVTRVADTSFYAYVRQSPDRQHVLLAGPLTGESIPVVPNDSPFATDYLVTLDVSAP